MSDFAHPGPEDALRGDIPLDPRGEDPDRLEQPDESIELAPDADGEPDPDR